VASSTAEAAAAAKALGGSVVVKAQIHAGGRGKGGGVKVATDADEAAKIADQILGMTSDHPSDRPGRPRRAQDPDRKRHCRSSASCTLASSSTACREAGVHGLLGRRMDIEEVAAKTPELILKETIRARPWSRAVSKRASWFRIGVRRPARTAAVAA